MCPLMDLRYLWLCVVEIDQSFIFQILRSGWATSCWCTSGEVCNVFVVVSCVSVDCIVRCTIIHGGM